MPAYDFDFQRYVERRKGERAAERREGSAYAYSGDQRLRGLLARLRPVTLALEASARLWKATARAELLGTSVRITERSYPRVHKAAELCAARLHVALPPLHASPLRGMSAHTFGTDDEPVVLLHAELCDALSDDELCHVVGAELGRIQNGATLLATAHHYLHRAPGGFLRWIVGPARAALDGWWRRAAITADRAGLLCSRDLGASASAIRKLARAASDEPMVAPRGNATGSQPAAGAPPSALDLVGARIAALEIFARSSYFLGVRGEPGGISPEETDRQVAELLKGIP